MPVTKIIKAHTIKTILPPPRIKITEYPVPDYSTINIISVISPKEIYAFTNSTVYLFNGSKFKALYRISPPMIISAADCNGRFVVLDYSNYQNLLPGYKFIILELSRNASGITISRKIECNNIPFTHMPGMIKFLNNNILFIDGLMEYGFLNLNNLSNKNILIANSINFKHFAFPISGDMEMALSKGFSCINNVYPLYIFDKAYYVTNNTKYASLKFLFKIPAVKKFNSYSSIQEFSLADTNFGCVIFNNHNTCLFFRRNKNGKLNYHLQDSLILTSGRHISFNHVRKVLTFSRSNVLCFTNEGEIFRYITVGNHNSLWQKIGDLRNVNFNNCAAFDSNDIYLFGNSLTRIKILHTEKTSNLTKTNNVNNGNLFSIIQTDQISQNYGAGVIDLNKNGKEDIYLVDLENVNRFIINQGRPVNDLNLLTNENNIANQHGAGGREKDQNTYSKAHNYEVGVAIGDLTNSGSEDIYLTTLQGNNILLENSGKGYFRDATVDFNLNKDIGRSEGAVLADVNNDGWLDIFTTSFLRSNSLFINYDGIRFNDITAKANLKSKGASICAAFADINNDGYPDLYIGNWMRNNRLYLNNGNGTFEDITKESGTGLGVFHKTNSVLFADFNNDGLPDLFVGNRGTPDKLFINLGGGKFKDVSTKVGLTDTLSTYGAAFGDFDNDGYLDLFVDYLGGIKIYKNMMGVDGGRLYFKDYTRTFVGKSFIPVGYNTGAVTLDYDNDGDLDIFVCQYSGKSFMLKNLLNDSFGKKNNFLEVKLVGSKSNRDAVGAKLRLFRNDTLIAYREVESGYGYASSSSKIQHFGLGRGKGKFKLQVTFPASGVVKTLPVQPGTFITVKEYSGIKEEYFLAKKALLRYLMSKDFINSLLRLLVFVVFLFILAKIKIFRLPLNTPASRHWSLRGKMLSKCIPIPFYLVIIFTAIYLLLEYIFNSTQSLFMNPYYYMSNTSNFFYEDALPIAIALAFEAGYLKLKKDRELRNISSENLILNLWTILRRFEHGEGMLMNINRLSLFMKNIAFDVRYGIIPKHEVVDRIIQIVNEFKTITLVELNKISTLLVQIREAGNLTAQNNNHSKSLDYSNASKIISTSGTQLLNLNEEFINMINAPLKDKDIKLIVKLASDFGTIIYSLKNEIMSIREEVKKYFVSDINKAIEQTINKFKLESSARFLIDCSNKIIGQKIFITFSELNEILSIIIQNAIDEIGRNENIRGIIKISLEESRSNVFVKVEDNGKGIPFDMKEIIFEDAFSTKQKYHGFGLSYVKACLNKYEGSIAVEQSELGGALFLIRLNKMDL